MCIALRDHFIFRPKDIVYVNNNKRLIFGVCYKVISAAYERRKPQ